MALAFQRAAAAAGGSGVGGVLHVGTRRWVAGAGGSAVPLAYEEFRSAPVGDSASSSSNGSNGGGEERTVVVLHGSFLRSSFLLLLLHVNDTMTMTKKKS